MEVDGNKAPGSHGFLFKFAQTFWDVFKGDLLELFQSFYENTEFDHRFFESFISLITKVQGMACLNDFQPISLFGWVHKFVVRVLTSRLWTVIDKLISHNQTTFIRGQSIHDG